MLISFFTFGIFAAYAPYDSSDSNTLAVLCQAVIFVVFLSAAILEVSPDNPFLDGVQLILLFTSVVSLLFSEFFKTTPGTTPKPTAVARMARRLQAKVVKALDACIGLKTAQGVAMREPAAAAAAADDEPKNLTA